MLINEDNYSVGNRAMAWTLLLYYHLLREGGITNDQTYYLDASAYEAFELCQVQVAPACETEIDARLIREGAVIAILCDLDDMVAEYDKDFLAQPYTRKALTAHESGMLAAIPEADGIFKLMAAGEDGFDYAAYKTILDDIYRKYVVDRFKALVGDDAAT